jgi:predicted nucleic acid-binding protein
VFVDTSAWYALLDRKDGNHTAAVRFLEESQFPFVTSTYVLDETVTLVKKYLGQAMATRLGQQIWDEEVTRLVRVTPEDEMRAWTIFTRYEDKGFSYTDCTSFALMERLHLGSAFAFDVHFTQYGRFVRLPAN